jgi:hypothetical protein
MGSLRYYLDEDVYFAPRVAAELRSRGTDVVTTVEEGRAGRGLSDPDQLTYATSQGRVMVTQDQRIQPTGHHSGLVIMQRRLSVGAYIDYLELLALETSPDDLLDQVHYCQWR